MSEEDKKTQEELKEGWDKEKQKVEQVEANYQKQVEKTEVITAENAALSEQLEVTQKKVAELEKKAKDQESAKTDPSFDPDFVDGNVIKELTRARTVEKKLLEKVEQLEGIASKHEQTEQQRANKAAEDLAVNKMCTDLEAEHGFGPELRSDAITLAEKLVKDGTEKPVTDGIEGMILMRKCYKQLSEKKEEDVPTDKGGGGGPALKVTGKAGTNDEVLADMRTNQDWRENPVGGPEEPDFL